MKRKFTYGGRTYQVDGINSEWVLRFWDDGGVDVGSARNRAGGCIHELTETELRLHLARALMEQRRPRFGRSQTR